MKPEDTIFVNHIPKIGSLGFQGSPRIAIGDTPRVNLIPENKEEENEIRAGRGNLGVTVEDIASIRAPIVRPFKAGEIISIANAVAVRSNSGSADFESGSTEYLSIADGSQTGLDLSGDFTFEAWVKPESLPGGYILAKYETTGNQRAYYLSANSNGTVEFAVSDDGTTSATHFAAYDTDASQLTAGVWTHIAVTFDISEQNDLFYINGSLVASTPIGGATVGSPIHNSTADFTIGARNGGNTPYDGLIDDVRVWSVERTPTEISDNYQRELLGTESNLVGYWKLNGDFKGATSNANDLTDNNTVGDSTDVGFWLGTSNVEIFKADASDTFSTNTFIGFATVGISKGIAGNIAVSGVVSGFANLIIGGQYYLSDTAGAMALTAGTVTRKIGVAVSTTQLLITNIW